MPKTMLIDAYHREETRVAVLQGGKVEDFDFEYASRKPLRGNIYLARVTRVEPSLQAAFIEYGGNRHGFLAFGEIHPDYYQIPVADRDILRKAEALEVELAQKLAELSQDEGDDGIDLDDDDELRGRGDDDLPGDRDARASDVDDDDDTEVEDHRDEAADDLPADFVPAGDADDEPAWHAADESLIEALGENSQETDDDPEARRATRTGDDEEEEEEEEEERSAALETEASEAATSDESDVDAQDGRPDIVFEPRSARHVGGDENETGDNESRRPARNTDAAESQDRQKEIDSLRARYEEAKRERNRLLRAYKIQEVIKRRQIMLVQVVKEERGNKGAALTTYLSLAGRYGVLMPNTARGGGISRKITSQADRKRLKKAMSELEIPATMGLIIRTAGAKRSKIEIKRDYDYLSRLWETIRSKTLESVAPTLIYEEASLMKRAIRDLYDKDTEKVLVQGEEGYREAKDFMKMLMPSHAKHVQQYKGDLPLFLKYRVEEQLDQMYEPVVQLKSGGYLVIQQTEALVSIDVNSGKSTKERNVEQTALKTNSEAAVEVARQCRLRDLAGLIVVDFIDMEENRNNRAVEKKLKDAMKNDRARTQIGSISTFGLLEMSRQRRRSGIVDGTTQACPVCEGAGHVRSHEMAALRILRAAEGIAASGKHGLVTVKTSTDVALYILNTKRSWLERMEALYGVKTNVLADASRYGDQYDVSGSGAPKEGVSLRDTIGDDSPLSDFEAPELPGDTSDEASEDDDESGDNKPKRRRRRRRRRGSSEDRSDDTDHSSSDDQDDDESDDEASSDADGDANSSDDDDSSDDDRPKRRRRRGRRGGRRNRKANGDETTADRDTETKDDGGDEEPSEQAVAASAEADVSPAAAVEERGAAEDAGPQETSAATDSTVVELDDHRQTAEDEAAGQSHQETEQPVEAEVPGAEPEAGKRDENRPKQRRAGWWQRAFQKD